MAFLRWRQLAVVLVIALAASHSARADGPINPLNDPAVTAKYPPSNVFCGGPFADNLKGPRDPIFEKHFFYTKEGGDFLDTQNGNDWIFCGNGKNDVYSEDGDDVIVTGSGIDLIIGGPGSDRIWSGAGDDYVDGDPCGKGNLCAGPGVTYDDYIRLGPGNDVSIGRKGNDEIWGEDGDDKLLGNEGSDILRGGNGKDTLAGGGENEDGFDDVRGGNDDDTLYSGRGGALLYGEQGNGTLESMLWIVGSLTSVNQLTFVVDNSVPLTNVYLKGCSKPFVTVKRACPESPRARRRRQVAPAEVRLLTYCESAWGLSGALWRLLWKPSVEALAGPVCIRLATAVTAAASPLA
eukprot:jgi/Mesen1/4857/ME000244S04036